MRVAARMATAGVLSMSLVGAGVGWAAAAGADLAGPAGSVLAGSVAAVPVKYVALGDSFSSGAGVPPYVEEPGEGAAKYECLRSSQSFGHVAAADLGADLKVAACSGAVTKHIVAPIGGGSDEPAQLSALGTDTDLVSISIGGNDLGFMRAMQACVAAGLTPGSGPCANDPELNAQASKSLARLAGKTSAPSQITPIGQLFGQIAAKAPRATVVAVGYPQLFAVGDGPGVRDGRCQGVMDVDRRWIAEQVKALNSVIKADAVKRGVRYVDGAAVFAGHELCGAAGSWITDLSQQVPFHPTAEGHAALGKAVAQAARGAHPVDDPSAVLKPGETFTQNETVREGATRLTAILEVATPAPGHDVVETPVGGSGAGQVSGVSLTMVRPDGRQVRPATTEADVRHSSGPGYRSMSVLRPAKGGWQTRVKVEGGWQTFTLPADDRNPRQEMTFIGPEGIPIKLTVIQEFAGGDAPKPVVNLSAGTDGGVSYDSTGSTSPAGEVLSAQWFVTSRRGNYHVVGPVLRIARCDVGDVIAITLVLTDARGQSTFVAVPKPRGQAQEQDATQQCSVPRGAASPV